MTVGKRDGAREGWAADAARKSLFRHMVSHFSEHVLKPGSTTARRRLEAFEWLDPEAIRQAQWNTLCSLLRHAAATVLRPSEARRAAWRAILRDCGAFLRASRRHA